MERASRTKGDRSPAFLRICVPYVEGGKGGIGKRREMRRTWVVVLPVVDIADNRKDTHGDDDYDCEPVYRGVRDGEEQPIEIPRRIEELPTRKWNGVVYLQSRAATLDS